MSKFCVFAGTTEGRKIVEHLCRSGQQVTACVATEYGQTLLPEYDNLTVSAQRLPPDQIECMLDRERFDLVIDATHPYAVSITESIFRACRQTNSEYVRLLRPASELPEEAVFVDTAAEAAEYLSHTEGKVLLTVGSKELPVFAAVEDAAERMFARILPMEASLRICTECGFSPAHIIAMQGPFTEELNIALMKSTGASWLVTKDGGNVGGFAEKVSSVRAVGGKLIVIGRPSQREGMSYKQITQMLAERFHVHPSPIVTIAGIGPGNNGAMTEEVHAAIAQADCVIGAGRMLENIAGKPQFTAIAPDTIAEVIRTHTEYSRFAVLMSGDSGFFSGTRKLIPLLADCSVTVLPGISSLSCLCAKLKTSYEDIHVFSLHGRSDSILPIVRKHPRVFTLVGGNDGVSKLCRDLVRAGYPDAKVSVGSRLSYPDEMICTGTALELSAKTFPALSAVLIEHDHQLQTACTGLPDEAFQRGGDGENVVPMTKREIRAVCMSYLQIRPDSVCWDIGAGTGSVSIEMAIQAYAGKVYAVEKKPAAQDLLRENISRFEANNVHVVSGAAPECCKELPAPTHVFIGGSSGNMKQILQLAMDKNPKVRIVATAIALETVAELTACTKEFPFTATETVCINVSKDRKAGQYHLMTAQNPVYIFPMQAGEEKQ